MTDDWQPRQVYRIERMMGDDVLMTFADRHCLCISGKDIDARVAKMKEMR